MIRILISLICMFCLISGGCTDDNMMSSSPTLLPGKTVPVKLSLSTEAYNTSFTGETRAGGGNSVLSVSTPGMDIELVETPVTRAGTAIDEENAIYNYTLLQFAGTTATSTLYGKKTYPCPDGVIDTKDVELKLTTTGSGGTAVKHRFVVIANVSPGDFNSLQENSSTYSDLQNLNFGLNGNQSFPLRELSVSGVNKKTMVMCGLVDAVIAASGKQIAIVLQRTVAKVTFNIQTDNADFSKFENWDVSLMNIPNKSYFNTLGRTAVFPALDEKKLSSSYWSKVLTTPTMGDALPIGGKSLYIPVNLQKTVTTSTLLTRRNFSPLGGTYLQIMGREMAPGGTTALPVVKDFVLYQIFLGKNLTTDFSIYPNYNQTYNITLKGRIEDDSNVIRLIPGKFSGKLVAYSSSSNTPLQSTTDPTAVKWEYSQRIETYFADSPFPWQGSGIEDLGRYDLRWYAGSSFSNLGATSLTDGYANTRTLQGTTITYIHYPAALACYMGLNGLGNAGQHDFTWYLPSIGELIGTWVASSSMVSQQSPSYWSSTALKDVPQAFVITNEGEVKTAPVNEDSNRHYVRGCRNPDKVTANK